MELEGTAGGGIRPDMRITKRNSLPCALRQDNLDGSFGSAWLPLPPWETAGPEVIVHREKYGFTSNRQRQSFVPWSAAQLCTSVSSGKDTVTGGTRERLCPSSVPSNAADLIPTT